MTLWTKAASLEARPAGSSWNFRPSACQVSKDWDWIAGLLKQALMGLAESWELAWSLSPRRPAGKEPRIPLVDPMSIGAGVGVDVV